MGEFIGTMGVVNKMAEYARFVPTLSPNGRGLQIHEDDQNKADI